MNERIKKLAEQTGYIWHASGDPQIYEFTPEKLEKFAELIVAECIDVVSDCSVEYCTRPQIASEIKQHFGVEE